MRATVLAVIVMASAACSSPSSSLPTLKDAVKVAVSEICGPAEVGKPLSTYIVLKGGVPPYRVTWYVDGRPGGLNNVKVQHVGPTGIPMFSNGTKYTITFIPKAATDTVTVHVVDVLPGGVREEDIDPVVGPGSGCSIA